MKSLLFVSVVCWLCLTSCASALSGFHRNGQRVVGMDELPGIVDTTAGVNRYNLKMDLMKKHFSGLLLVKRMGEQSYRTVFTTHFGLRVFDFEFTGDSLVVHYCMEPLYKEKVIALFRNDFSRLFGLSHTQVGQVYSATDGINKEVYRFGKKLYYRKNLKQGVVEQISSGRGWKKTVWSFSDYESGYPSMISIHHALFPVRLELERLSSVE